LITQLNTKRICIFLAIAVGIPWSAALALYPTVAMPDLIKAAMLANTIFVSTPLLANVITRLVTREGCGRLWLRPNLRGGWPFYLAAMLLPLLAVIVGGASFYLFFPNTFDPNLAGVRNFYASRACAAGEARAEKALAVAVAKI
jgi:hypothetical protein